MESIEKNEFDMVQISPKNRKIAQSIVSTFLSKPKIYESDYDIDGGWFAIILGNNYEYLLEYSFDVTITSRSSYDSGDYWTPPSGESAEFEIDITGLKMYIDGDEVYDGKDFTDFQNLKFPEGKHKAIDVVYDHINDRIQELESDY